MTQAKRFLLVLGIVVFCLGVDRVTKEIARHQLSGRGTTSILADTIRLQYEENRGVILSLGSDLSGKTRFLLFIVLVGLCLVALTAFSCFNRTLTPGETAALSMIVGGGTGNLIDRILFGGVVLDFLNLGVNAVRTAVFNAADVMIVAGAVLFLLLQIRRHRKLRTTSAELGTKDGSTS